MLRPGTAFAPTLTILPQFPSGQSLPPPPMTDDSTPNDTESSAQPSKPARDGEFETSSRRVVSSEELLRGQREVRIEHGREMYRLRVTSAGKLYLTK
jgi:hemin uptake protein HemP